MSVHHEYDTQLTAGKSQGTHRFVADGSFRPRKRLRQWRRIVNSIARSQLCTSCGRAQAAQMCAAWATELLMSPKTHWDRPESRACAQRPTAIPASPCTPRHGAPGTWRASRSESALSHPSELFWLAQFVSRHLCARHGPPTAAARVPERWAGDRTTPQGDQVSYG